MEYSVFKKFKSAIDAADINLWEAITDIPTHFYNGINQINVVDEEEESLINFSMPITTVSPYTGQIVAKVAHISDVHEVRFGANLDQVKKFLDSYGITLTKDQMKILVEINGGNYSLKPETGDYLFRELSEEEISKLTDEEKAEYNSALKAFKEEQAKFSRPIQVLL